MSTTPRGPWAYDLEDHVITGPDGRTIGDADMPDGTLIVRAVNSFDALLAVAKAAIGAQAAIHEEWGPDADLDLGLDLDGALTALDAGHPGWREWTT